MEYSFAIVVSVRLVWFQFGNPWFMFYTEYWLHFLFKLCFRWFDYFLGLKNFMINSKVRNFIIMRPNRITLKVSLFSTILEIMPRSTQIRLWSVIRIRFCQRLNSFHVVICVWLIIFNRNSPCFSWFFWF